MMDTAPFFSVVMPVYNGERFLPDAPSPRKARKPSGGGREAVAADGGFLANGTRFFASGGRDLGPWRAPREAGKFLRRESGDVTVRRGQGRAGTGGTAGPVHGDAAGAQR